MKRAEFLKNPYLALVAVCGLAISAASFSISYFPGIAIGSTVTAICSFLVRHRRAKLLGGLSLFLILYCLIGIPNFSERRGYLTPESQSAFFFGLQVILSSIFAVLHITATAAPRSNMHSYSTGIRIWSPAFIAILLLPSVSALPYILYDRGLEFLTDSRFGTSPLVQLSALFCFIPFSLSLYNIRVLKDAGARVPHLYYFIISYFLFYSILLGYRNVIVGAIICYIIINMERLALKRIAMYAICCLFIVVSVDMYRRSASSVLTDVASLKQKYGASGLPDYFAALHFAFREGFGISQRMLFRYDEPYHTIFFADLLTLMPGYQPSGGRIIAELSGGSVQEGGLNAGLIGLSLFEFGRYGGYAFLAMIASAFSIMICWRVPDDRLSEALLASIASYEFLLLFHRGDMRVYSYFLLSGIALTVYFRRRAFLMKDFPKKTTKRSFRLRAPSPRQVRGI